MGIFGVSFIPGPVRSPVEGRVLRRISGRDPRLRVACMRRRGRPGVRTRTESGTRRTLPAHQPLSAGGATVYESNESKSSYPVAREAVADAAALAALGQRAAHPQDDEGFASACGRTCDSGPSRARLAALGDQRAACPLQRGRLPPHGGWWAHSAVITKKKWRGPPWCGFLHAVWSCF